MINQRKLEKDRRIDSEAPHQPGVSHSFPKRKFGKKQEVLWGFQRCWFAKWNWLHYSEVEDSVLCFTCWKAEQEGKLRSTSKDQAFISRGFTNWKDGPECFCRHEESKCHKEAYDMIVSIPNTVPNVGKMLSTGQSEGFQKWGGSQSFDYCSIFFLDIELYLK